MDVADMPAYILYWQMSRATHSSCLVTVAVMYLCSSSCCHRHFVIADIVIFLSPILPVSPPAENRQQHQLQPASRSYVAGISHFPVDQVDSDNLAHIFFAETSVPSVFNYGYRQPKRQVATAMSTGLVILSSIRVVSVSSTYNFLADTSYPSVSKWQLAIATDSHNNLTSDFYALSTYHYCEYRPSDTWQSRR